MNQYDQVTNPQIKATLKQTYRDSELRLQKKENVWYAAYEKRENCKPPPIKIFEIKNHTEFYNSKTGILKRLFDSQRISGWVCEHMGSWSID